MLKEWNLDVAIQGGTTFLTTLLQDEGDALGAYDGRVKANDTGIAGSVSPDSGGNDPTITAVGGVYTTMWNVYLNEELRFTSISPFMDLNDQAFQNWNFNHVDPTGTQMGGITSLYTAGDLAAALELNPYLRVFFASGYYDAVTPFFQTVLDVENMPLGNPKTRDNIAMHFYRSGHMIYLDNESRTAMKADLANFYGSIRAHSLAFAAARPPEGAGRMSRSPYSRRFARTPY